jgi:hypothetical protein
MLPWWEMGWGGETIKREAWGDEEREKGEY